MKNRNTVLGLGAVGVCVQELKNMWRETLKPDEQGHYIHPCDRSTLKPWLAKRPLTAVEGDLARPPSGRLHLQLPPVPFVGDLETADIVFAMINPAAENQDYIDARCARFQSSLRANLSGSDQKCFALDEESAPTAWHTYYRGVFNCFVTEHADRLAETGKLQSDRSRALWNSLKRRIVILELVPYYSQKADMLLRAELHNTLPTAKAAKAALKELAKRSKRDLLIICRWPHGATRWDLPVDRCTVSESRRGLSQTAQRALYEFLDHKP